MFVYTRRKSPVRKRLKKRRGTGWVHLWKDSSSPLVMSLLFLSSRFILPLTDLNYQLKTNSKLSVNSHLKRPKARRALRLSIVKDNIYG